MSDTPPMVKPLEDLREEYWMIKKLGYGGFGKVYLIRNKTTHQQCAAKHQKISSYQMSKISRREATILRLLTKHQDSNVVRFVDYFEGEGQSVLLTEYLPGGELFQRLASSNYELTESKCRNFVRQILLGLQFIHSHRIVHLDLKPHNIIFVTDSESNNNNTSSSSFNKSHHSTNTHQEAYHHDHLKIIDFGLARQLEGDRIPITRCGTLEFISPEVVRCSHAGTYSDMWSLGVVTFMMVSGGYSPFWAGDEYRTQRKIVRGQYSFDPTAFQEVSKEAKNFISLLLTSYNERMSTKECLEHAWIKGSYLDTLKVLETTWMRKYLARRRWQRWFNTIRAMNRLTLLLTDGKNEEDSILNNIGLKTYQPSERWV